MYIYLFIYLCICIYICMYSICSQQTLGCWSCSTPLYLLDLELSSCRQIRHVSFQNCPTLGKSEHVVLPCQWESCNLPHIWQNKLTSQEPLAALRRAPKALPTEPSRRLPGSLLSTQRCLLAAFSISNCFQAPGSQQESPRTRKSIKKRLGNREHTIDLLKASIQ